MQSDSEETKMLHAEWFDEIAESIHRRDHATHPLWECDYCLEPSDRALFLRFNEYHIVIPQHLYLRLGAMGRSLLIETLEILDALPVREEETL